MLLDSIEKCHHTSSIFRLSRGNGFSMAKDAKHSRQHVSHLTFAKLPINAVLSDARFRSPACLHWLLPVGA